MKNLIPLCIFLMTPLLFAETIQSPIHSVERLENSPYIVKFSNGRVGFLPAAEKSLGENLNQIPSQRMVKAKLDDQGNIYSLQMMEEENSKQIEKLLQMEEPPVFEPTIIPSLEDATRIFNRLNPNYKRSSECSNRAHVWASEEYKNNGIKSKKVFALFTASYINRIRFKWWFHVAPMLAVKEGNRVEYRVLDFMFDHRPKTIKEWTDNFVFSQRPCLPTTRFSEYDVNPQTEDCYLMTASMYDWTPADLSRQERESYYKTQFSQGEIRAAYSEAF